MKVSIITVCFNSSKTIIDTINSVNKQTYLNIEHVFIDGGSSDKTLNIINSNSQREKIIISEKDLGLYDAMNKGLTIASGDVIGFLNSDDYFSTNNAVSQIIKLISNNNIVIGGIQMINSKNKTIRKWMPELYDSKNIENNFYPHPGFYIRNNLLVTVGFFNLKYKIASDFDWMLRCLINSNNQVVVLEECIVYMRLGGESTKNIKNILTGNFEIIKSLQNNLKNINILYYFFKKIISKVKQFFKK
tara:strand:- start:89 stop:826 length:738 start_codon:yes stop_codon:yes gene_type:complete